MIRPVLAGTAILLIASPAVADPCKAVPDQGPMPGYLRAGERFSGPVVYVGDGDGLCVSMGAGTESWVEVRLSDFYAPELNEPGGLQAKAALETVALGKQASCVAGRRSFDRVVARCTIDGITVGDRMRSAGIAEGGKGRGVRTSRAQAQVVE